jgi:hypothetical protein
MSCIDSSTPQSHRPCWYLVYICRSVMNDIPQAIISGDCTRNLFRCMVSVVNWSSVKRIMDYYDHS